MGERDKGERQGRATAERDEGERLGRGPKKRDKGERERRGAKKRDKGERERRGAKKRDSEKSHLETPHPHFLTPPHTFNLSITVLPQIHLNVEVLLAFLYILVAREESAF